MSVFYATRIEDIDGDLIEIAGNSDDELVTISLIFDEDEVEETGIESYYSEVTPRDARIIAAALVMAAGQAEGNGIGL